LSQCGRHSFGPSPAAACGAESMLRAHMSYGRGGAQLWWPRPRRGMGEEAARRGVAVRGERGRWTGMRGGSDGVNHFAGDSVPHEVDGVAPPGSPCPCSPAPRRGSRGPAACWQRRQTQRRGPTSPHLNAEERPSLLICLASRKEVGLPVLGEERRVPVWRWADRRCRWRGRTGKGADQPTGPEEGERMR
jgi:hypothetical protein